MGNSQTKGQLKSRQKKQVHWKATVSERPGPPGKPQLVPGAEITPDVVTIHWDKPKFDGGAAITGYLVEHRRTGSPHWVRATPLLVQVPELTLSGLEPGWRYQFRITAQNAVGMSDPGEISEPLTVTLQRSVITAPKFTEELKDTTALENEMAEFVVHIIGQPPPKICWFKDGYEIFSSRRTRIITENNKSVLTIHQVALADEGEIKCTATNKAGHVSTKAAIKVEAPPVIRLPRQYEDGLLFELGEVIRLKVSIAGRPQPLVFWSHNGETIQTNERYEITETDRSSVLKLGEAQRSDRGEYQIRAVNQLGEDATSFLVTVTDKPKPPIKVKVIMSLGKTVTLSWDVPEDDGGCKIGNYIVEYYRIGWNVWLKASTCRQLTTTLSDLIEGSEYKFRVKAESPYGISDPSDETDVIFIPDPKRGMLSPPIRSRSQPRDVKETSPVPPKRRSTSSTRNSNKEQSNLLIPQNIAPMPPKREKIRSPQKSPESSPLANRKYMFDRSSLARELAYGSPDVKYKKSEQKIQHIEPITQTKKIPSSIPARDRSPSLTNQPALNKESNIQRERSPSLINQLLPNKEPTTTRERSPSLINQLFSNNVPSFTRERSPSIINQLLSNILPKKSPSPSPRSTPPKENTSPINTPTLVSEYNEPLNINSLKGDHLDRLSPNIVNRRLSSPTLLNQRDRSPSPMNVNKRDRSPSLVENMLERNSSIQRSKSPSPNRSPSPSGYSITNDDESRRGSLKSYETNDNDMDGSSEFMLVLVDDQDDSQDYYLFEDSLIPPPLSLSAPELGAESEMFLPLKTSVSSTELLHERAFARFMKDAEETNQNMKPDKAEVVRRASLDKNQKLKIVEMDEKRSSIPKILINSKDNEEIVGLERKSSLTRRLSAGINNITQHYLWAKRRHSLRNANENSDLNDIKSKFSDKIKDNLNKRPISEEIEEERKSNGTKLLNESLGRNNSSNEKNSLNKKQESVDEESIYSESEESEESEDERLKFDLSPPNIQPQEEETYHPRMAMSLKGSKFEEPFEILSKPSSLPDPNFIPKPILKHKEPEITKKSTPDKPARKFFKRSCSPLPTSSGSDRSRSPSPSLSNKLHQQLPVHSIPESQIISAAEAAKQKRLSRQSSQEEYKVVAAHYMDILKEYGSNKRQPHTLFLNRDELKAAAAPEEKTVVAINREPSPVRTIPKRNPSPCPPRRLMTNDNKIKAKSLRSRSSSRTRSRDSSATRTVTPTAVHNKLIYISSASSSRSISPELEALQIEAELKVRSMVDYITDVAMFLVACWLYLFKDPRLAIPILIIMVYRQIKDEVQNLIPAWMTKKKKH